MSFIFNGFKQYLYYKKVWSCIASGICVRICPGFGGILAILDFIDFSEPDFNVIFKNKGDYDAHTDLILRDFSIRFYHNFIRSIN
jgi:hypothetical protein